MQQLPDIFDFISDLFGGFDFGSFLSLLLSFLGGFGGGGGSA